ncbi:PDZ and LIM domain protein 5-like isoform X3 [Protopterus annectens]|uniref:PDZ and LIM domain protein 5-like isoform X3 n=1 Tax=Protopterus annectens TaxID=7888 RepID=UPI001CF9F29E|nr:PDZ and LIM domain protein 5-like isoform X3 [Protopterus annectens]
MSNYNVSLVGSAPWGFRLQGGKDFNMPLTISRLTDGGKAAQAGISVGDMVLSIDGMSTEGMTHLEAQNKIKACTGSVKMNLQRVPTVNTFVSVPAQKEEPKEVVKPVPVISTAPVVPKVSNSAVNLAYNKTARPFGAVSSPKITSIPSPSSAFTPTAVTSARASPTPPPSFASAASPPHPAPVQPIAPSPPGNTRPNNGGYAPAAGVAKPAVNPSFNVPRQPATHGTSANLYSSSNVVQAAEVQRKELKENQGDSKQQNGAPPPTSRRHILDTNVDFPHTPLFSGASKQRLMVDTEDWHPRTGTTQSRSFRILAQITGTESAVSTPSPAVESQNEQKECQTETGESSHTLHIADGLEDRDKQSVATQTFQETAVCVSLPDPSSLISHTASASIPERPGSALPTSSAADPKPECIPCTMSAGALLFSPKQERKLLENPLDALPKCAPYPPPVMHILKLDSQVATLSRTAEVRFSKVITESAVTEHFSDATCLPNNTGEVKSFLVDAGKCTVAVQTCEPSTSPVKQAAVGYPSERQAESASSMQSEFHRKFLENPLQALPKSAPPVLLPVSQSPEVKKAVSTVSTIVSAQARLCVPAVSRALLDALLITPVATVPPVQCKRPKRRSEGAVSVHKTKSDFVAPTPVGGHAAASVKTMSKAPANVRKPAYSSAATVSTFQSGGGPGTGKVTGPQSASQAAHSMPKATAMSGHVTQSGWSSNSPAKQGVWSTGNRPAPQPQPMDQDTLVQRAEHIPAGKRTPMCAECNAVIRGPFLMALGKSWHPEEFNCAHCKTSMADLGFVQEKGFIYCERCYEQFFAPECARCQRKILGEVINALKQTWHVGCFICVVCHRPIRNNVFHMEDGEPYCETDFYSLFGTMCHGCEFPIEAGDKFLEALGYTWHDTCFVCSVCCTSLEGQAFFSKKDKPLCKKHAHGGNI